jgi:hypothetical protein
MTQQQAKMAMGLGSITATNNQQGSSKLFKATKLATILRQLTQGKSLNRFEAEQHHDHCLNTTISVLQNRHGIKIDRERETVACLNGTATVSVNRYWLNTESENLKCAQILLNFWERRT